MPSRVSDVNLRSHVRGANIDRHVFPLDTWAWVENTPQHGLSGPAETQFTVGNGYLGMRGNTEEARTDIQLGTFVNGFHETWPIQHAEQAYGLARQGQTIVGAPDTTTIRLYVDDEPLILSKAELSEYQRRLDFRTGQLHRHLVWRTSSGKTVSVNSTRMVSLTDKHLAVFTYRIRLVEGDASITLSSQLLNRQDGQDECVHTDHSEEMDPRKAEGLQHRVLLPRMHDHTDGQLVLGYQCAQSAMTIAARAEHDITTDADYEVEHSSDEDSAKSVFSVSGQEGQEILLVKYATYHTAQAVPARELGHRCARSMQRATQSGWRHAHNEQQQWLHNFWDRADIEIDGDDCSQQQIRWNLFQLAQMTARADTNGIAAKGVSGSGYSGHYFWDTEIYVMPFMTYSMPQQARNAMRFRVLMLPAAYKRARELGHRGALYPWRTINGEEASAYYAAGTAQYHIDADIAHALMQYVRGSGDDEFMFTHGVDVLVETARLFADLGFYDQQGRFHIHGVTGPDEYTAVVDNNLYTNVMARANLRAAAHCLDVMQQQWPDHYQQAAHRLDISPTETDQWKQAADNMFVAYDQELGIHPQDQHFLSKEIWDKDLDAPKRPLLLHFHPLVIYRHQVLKQADVVLALFLRGSDFSIEEKKRNFDYYDRLTTGDSTLSAVVQSIVASEIGYRDAAKEHFDTALAVDLADVHGNTVDGIHVASAGGVWSALTCGFGGFRDTDGVFSFRPRLPSQWNTLRYRLTITSLRILVEVDHHSIQFTVVDAPQNASLDIVVEGVPVTLTAGQPYTHTY